MTQFTIYNMDVFAALKQIEAESVDCILTSPPYWGLRDYGVAGQIGLEEHPQQWIDKMVAVSRELKRVLKPTGSYWLNVGDTYYGGCSAPSKINRTPVGMKRIVKNPDGTWLQPKQKMLMPHRLAIALQEDGWILRNDCVWHKPSHMPSSVQDRLTNSFEFVFHFVKQRRYYYDLDAIREPHKTISIERMKHPFINSKTKQAGVDWSSRPEDALNPSGKNPADVWQSWGGNEQGEYFGEAQKDYESAGVQDASDVKRRILQGFNPNGVHPSDFWEINPEPYREAHFACFPTELVRRPLKATCPKQICNKCGKARERIIEQNGYRTEEEEELQRLVKETGVPRHSLGLKVPSHTTRKELGFSDCGCNVGWKSGVVLDPFVGSGTTLFVAQEMGLDGIGIELNPKYIPLIKKRLLGDANQQCLNLNKITVVI